MDENSTETKLMSGNNSICHLVLLGMFGALVLNAPSLFAQVDSFDRESVKITDSIELKSGARLFGVLKSEGKDDGRPFVIFETLDGGLLKLDVARMVNRGRIHTVDELDREYNQFISTLDDTAEGHWELCNWLGDQASGKVRFKDQIRFHHERIMQLDPNDDRVKQLLGFRLIKEQNRWVPAEQYYQSLGYEKNGTSWTPTLQRQVSARFENQNSIEGERKKAFAGWKKEVRKSNDLAAIRNELFRICDAPAVVLIFEEAKEEPNAVLRRLFVEAFGRVPTYTAMKALCYFAVEEPSVDIRDRALTLLAQEHYNQASATAILSGYLGHGNRAYLLNAAFAIGEIGNEAAVLPLVGALVTRHQIAPGDQPGRMQTGVGSSGNVESFKMGGDTAPKILAFENTEVVNALKKITSQDYGFNGPAWRSWYIKNHTHYDVNVRR